MKAIKEEGHEFLRVLLVVALELLAYRRDAVLELPGHHYLSR